MELQVLDVLRRFTAVLLDMNGTFMFDGDRFGSGQDYAVKYRTPGGRQLAAPMVQKAVSECFEILEPKVRFDA